MIEEVKRIEHKGMTFRLVYNPEHYKIINGKRYSYKWRIQGREGKKGLFKNIFSFQTKKNALEHFKVKEMETNYRVQLR